MSNAPKATYFSKNRVLDPIPSKALGKVLDLPRRREGRPGREGELRGGRQAGPFFFAKCLPGLRPPKSGRPTTNSPISMCACVGFLRVRTL